MAEADEDLKLKTPAKAEKAAPEPQTAESPLQRAMAGILLAEQQLRDETSAAEALETFKRAAKDLPPDVLRQLLAREEVEELLGKAVVASGTQPGDPVYDGNGRELFRMPYDYQWVLDHMPMVEWTVPPHGYGRTIWEPPSWNGVSCQTTLRVGDTVETPCCFRDIVLDSYRQTLAIVRGQQHVLAGVGSRAADGITFESGTFEKPTEEQMIASGQWVRK